jgi:ATP-dependent Clp protease ATP-binding subunit ClpC
MSNRFTERAQRVVLIAQEEAKRLYHDYVGPEHVLLGLIGLGEGVAFEVLSGMADPRSFHNCVVKITGTGHALNNLGDVPFTPRAKRVLEHAVEEAQHMASAYVGTEHILLGLTHDTEGVAARVLDDLQISSISIRTGVLSILNPKAPESSKSRESNPRLTMFIANLMKYGVSVPAIEQAAEHCGKVVADKPLVRFAECIADEVISQ